MTQALVPPPEMGGSPRELRASVSAVPREYLDPPSAWNPTVGLFLGGYVLAAITIAGWFLWEWPLLPLVGDRFFGPAPRGHGDSRRLP